MWQRLQPREKILLATLGVGIVLFLLFYFLLIPQYDAYARNRNTLIELEAKARADEKVVSSEKAETELAVRATEKLNEVKPVFNNQMNDGLGLAHIGFEAMKNKVQIDSFTPSEIVNKGIYLELPVKFEVSGDYPDVVNFIKRMEDLPNLSDLRSLKIQPEKAADNTVESVVQNVVKDQLGVPDSDQNGRVKASFDLVIYSNTTPEARLELKQLAEWQVGRENAFLTPGSTSPLTGLVVPAQTVEPPLSEENDFFGKFIKQFLNQSPPTSNNTLPGSSGTVSLPNTLQPQPEAGKNK